MTLKKTNRAVVFLLALAIIFSNNINFAYGKEKEEESLEKVIAHGGGFYKGYETTNSFEAVNQAIKNGYKLIELDMELSSDNEIIMIHDWDRTAEHYYGASFGQKLSKAQFENLKVHNELHVMTFDMLVKLLDENKGVKIISDTKGDNLKLLEKIYAKYPKYISRIIPQIYDYSQWDAVSKMGYKDIIFTLYAIPNPNEKEIIKFSKEKNIYAVTMPDYYAEKGLCRKLADSGINVYVHPVSNYEDALHYISEGACGVYSGVLLPEEFYGIEEEYYFTTLKNGEKAKLTDERITGLKGLKCGGLKKGEKILYSIDGVSANISDNNVSNLGNGKHKLTAKIVSEKGFSIGSLDYFIFKSYDGLRILHKKYEYRLDEVTTEKDFYSTMEDAKTPKDIEAILEKSFIGAKGEYCYYNNATVGSYISGEEFLPVQTGNGGNIILPLDPTAKLLGASSVLMDKNRDVSILYNGNSSRVMINSYFIRQGFVAVRLKTPAQLYLNKAMASGEIYENLTGRTFIEKDNLIIILPKGLVIEEDLQKGLVDYAKSLFDLK